MQWKSCLGAAEMGKAGQPGAPGQRGQSRNRRPRGRLVSRGRGERRMQGRGGKAGRGEAGGWSIASEDPPITAWESREKPRLLGPPPFLTPRTGLCEEYGQGHGLGLESVLELVGRAQGHTARAGARGSVSKAGWSLPPACGKKHPELRSPFLHPLQISKPISISPPKAPNKEGREGAWPFVRGNLLISQICSMPWPFLSTPNQSLCKHLGLAFERLWALLYVKVLPGGGGEKREILPAWETPDSYQPWPSCSTFTCREAGEQAGREKGECLGALVYPQLGLPPLGHLPLSGPRFAHCVI